MGFKLAMPQLASPKSEPSALALTHARLKAWWNGDPTPAVTAVDGSGVAVNTSVPAEVDWTSVNARASSALWGNGRTYPSNAELEGQLVLACGGAKASRIALFGGGTGAMARVISEKTAVKIEIFENDPTLREVTEKALKGIKQGRRFGYHSFNWQPGTLPKSKADAALFVFQGGHEGRIEAGAFCE